MLGKDQLQGMWISVPTEWDENDQFDEATFRDEVAMLIEAGAHGVYTTGTTGEFYAMDWDEFKLVTDVFLDEVNDQISSNARLVPATSCGPCGSPVSLAV